ncbi:MAG: SDR family NAD(P)-dependent oxidoreductase, partial [Methylococcus sp.]
MSDTLLEGRVILVTGATGALGSVAAKACAQAGATVVLLGRTVRKLELLYDAILAAGAPKPAIYPLDLSGATENDYAELAEALTRELGGLHGL